jgi:UDPglucose--hexose-1-phosphate uridylyltransferase
MTPPEVKAYREPNSQPNQSGWTLRVVPNIGPAVDQSFPGVMLEERQVGQFLATEGFGYHYVVVETTAHVAHMADIGRSNVYDIVHMWRDMTNMITGDRNVRYVAIFQNYGPLAGASQPHCHSQIIGLPVIPTRIRNELRGSERFFDENKDCFYCREIHDDLRMASRIVQKSDNFVAWCPYTSKTPYQVVISPLEHQSYFANISTHTTADRLTEFASLLQDVLKRVKVTLNDPDYNLYIHTAPSNQPEMPHYHWHCQIEPITTAIMAGCEKGFGLYLNPRSPESAASDLRAAVIA